MKSKSLLALLIAAGLTGLMGCSTSQPRHNYAYEEPELYNESFNELGYPTNRKLSDSEKTALETRIRLKKLEDSLTPAEREQYYTYKSNFNTDEEKIEFLSLPTMAARDRYVETRGLYYKNNIYSPAVKEAIQKRDIIIGMSRQAVIDSWGEPQMVEVAGNEANGNERWRYSEYSSNNEGYQKEERMVIFEKGKVAGWKSHQ